MATKCIAQSTHVAVGTNIATYLWTVDPVFIIVSGQGTDTLVIESTSGTDVTGNVTCDVTNVSGADSSTAIVTHTHRLGIFEEFDQVLLYDINNIATEFIG